MVSIAVIYLCHPERGQLQQQLLVGRPLQLRRPPAVAVEVQSRAEVLDVVLVAFAELPFAVHRDRIEHGSVFVRPVSVYRPDAEMRSVDRRVRQVPRLEQAPPAEKPVEQPFGYALPVRHVSLPSLSAAR
jgi:hypothetical protein